MGQVAPLGFTSGLGEARQSLPGASSLGVVQQLSSVVASSDEAPPPVPLPRRRLLLGSFSSTTVTSRPGSFRRTLAEGESSIRPRSTSPSADCRLRGEREMEEGGDMVQPPSLAPPPSSRASSSNALRSLTPSFEFLPSGSPAPCGDVDGGEGTGLLWERFAKVLLFKACESRTGDGVLEDLDEESCIRLDEELLWCSERDGVADPAPVSLAAPRPLRPKRSLSGTSLGAAASASASGEAPRSRPLVLVEATTLSLSLGLRPRRAGVGWDGSVEAGRDRKSSSSSPDDAWSLRPSSLAWSRPFLAASTCSCKVRQDATVRVTISQCQ